MREQAIRARALGLRRVSRLTRWALAGGLALTGALSATAAAVYSGHSSNRLVHQQQQLEQRSSEQRLQLVEQRPAAVAVEQPELVELLQWIEPRHLGAS